MHKSNKDMKDINVPSYNSLLPGDRRVRAIQDLYDYISRWKPELDAMEATVPADASPTNQLATESSVATNSATFQGNYNLVTDLSLPTTATHSDIEAALGTAITDADNNDYCYVQIPTADATPTEVAKVERYKYNGTAWAFEFTLPFSDFTSAQWDAINSGVTAEFVADEPIRTNNYAAIVALASDPNAGVTVVTTNPEWKLVYTDANDAILLGKRQDNSWYFATDLDTILDVIIDGYTTT